MDKLYPPSIEGAIPAFYSTINKNASLENLQDGQGFIATDEDGYYITCQNNAADESSSSTFIQGKMQPLESNNNILYYRGLEIIKDNIAQLAIIHQESGEKTLELVIFKSSGYGEEILLNNNIYDVYFTVDRNNNTLPEGKQWRTGTISGQNRGIYLTPTKALSAININIPFSMNLSVSENDINGFALKFKTIQTNKEICILRYDTTNERNKTYNCFEHNQIPFIMDGNNLEKIYPGQFFKVQLAYLYGNTEEIGESDIGYYSTVGIIKYTKKPDIFIKEIKDKSDQSIYPLLSQYTGVCRIIDNTEKPQQQKFSLYKKISNEQEILLEETDWFLYDMEDENKNIFNPQTLLVDIENSQIQYIIKYRIKTINNLEEEISYKLKTPEIQESDVPLKLMANNNFDDSYIKVFFKEDGWNFSNWRAETKESLLNIEENNIDNQSDIIQQNENSEVMEVIRLISNNNQNISIVDNILLLRNIIYPFKNNEMTELKIYRSDATHDFKNWKEIASLNVNSFTDIFQWSYKDFNIEQGETYQYAFKEYKDDLEQEGQLFYSNREFSDFEDSFLYDGEKQLKIKFNPQISSFKINRLEQKTETIGNKFPYIFRNATVAYAEFPISGLISYHMDDNEEFMSKEELNIVLNNNIKRTSNPEEENLKNIETTNIVDYNIRAEKIFKLAVLDWLQNGKIKLFKSPTEGNYLVRLMNVSLSPEKQLSRMLHNFSCTAYEIEEYNYKNLSKLNFIKINN